jgi:hypothetical protein
VHDVRHSILQTLALAAAFIAPVGAWWAGLLPLLPTIGVVVVLAIVSGGRIHALLAASRVRTRISWHATNLVRYSGAPRGAGLRLARAVYGSLPGRAGSRATNVSLLTYYLSHDPNRRLDGPRQELRMVFEPDRTRPTFEKGSLAPFT